ncbi:MAG: hypothetical protein R3B13_05935 [Polyangiaceae bacterium]
MKTTTFTLAPLLAMLLLSGSALAGDKALAETLFLEGRKLMESGDASAACPKFEASNREDPSAGTMLNLAICYEKVGKTASAWATYKETAVRAQTEGRDAHVQNATEGARRLEPTLSTLTISVPASMPDGFVVKRGNVELSSGAYGVAVAVDPGKHVVVASAPGFKDFQTEIEVGSAHDKQTVTIPELEKAPDAGDGSQQNSTGSSGGADVRADTGSADNKMLGYVLTGVGGAALATGLVFGYLAQKQAGDAEDDPTLCPNKQCTPKGRDEIDGAETKALISTIGVGVGAVALGTGIYFLVTSSGSTSASRPQRTATTRVLPVVTTRGGGFALTGSF